MPSRRSSRGIADILETRCWKAPCRNPQKNIARFPETFAGHHNETRKKNFKFTQEELADTCCLFRRPGLVPSASPSLLEFCHLRKVPAGTVQEGAGMGVRPDRPPRISLPVPAPSPFTLLLLLRILGASLLGFSPTFLPRPLFPTNKLAQISCMRSGQHTADGGGRGGGVARSAYTHCFTAEVAIRTGSDQ